MERDWWLSLQGRVAKLVVHLLVTASLGSNPDIPKKKAGDISKGVANTH